MKAPGNPDSRTALLHLGWVLINSTNTTLLPELSGCRTEWKNEKQGPWCSYSLTGRLGQWTNDWEARIKSISIRKHTHRFFLVVVTLFFHFFFWWGAARTRSKEENSPAAGWHPEESFMDEVAFGVVLGTWGMAENCRSRHHTQKG